MRFSGTLIRVDPLLDCGCFCVVPDSLTVSISPLTTTSTLSTSGRSFRILARFIMACCKRRSATPQRSYILVEECGRCTLLVSWLNFLLIVHLRKFWFERLVRVRV